MDASLIREMITNGESNILELKLSPPRPSDLAERLCGFANGLGGYIVLGVEDATLQIKGVKNTSDAIDTIMQAIRLCKPPLRLEPPAPEVIIIDEVKLVVAYVPANDGTLYQAGNAFWIRRGTNNLSFSGTEIRDFLYRSGTISWETQPVMTATTDDFNWDLVNIYLQQRALHGTNPKRLSDPISVLLTLGCAKVTFDRDGSEVVRPTNAGLLLFGDMPQDFIRQAEVVCVLFSDNIGLRRYRDRRILTGSLTQQLEQIESFLSSNIKVSAQTKGFHRIDVPDYPIEALREAVVNSLVHRDYSISGETVRIFYYADRIETHNPGLLMPGVNLDALKNGRFLSRPRNPIICDVLKEMPGNYLERIGSGIKFIVDTMKEMGKPEPLFRESGEFVVTFRSGLGLEELPDALEPPYQVRTPPNFVENVDVESLSKVSESVPPQDRAYRTDDPNVSLTPSSRLQVLAQTSPLEVEGLEGEDEGEIETNASSALAPLREFSSYTGVKLEQDQRQELALRYLQRFGSITNKEYRRITGASESSALRDLEDLVRNGSLRAFGNKRTRKYLL